MDGKLLEDDTEAQADLEIAPRGSASQQPCLATEEANRQTLPTSTSVENAELNASNTTIGAAVVYPTDNQPQDPSVGDASTRGHAPPPATVQQCWGTAFDYNSHRWYFYNTATGQTQWNPPPGWMPSPGGHPPAPGIAQPEARTQTGVPAGYGEAVQPQIHFKAADAAEVGAPAQATSGDATGEDLGGQAAGASSSTQQQQQQQRKPHAPAPAAAPAQAAVPSSATPPAPGYYYYDAYARLQGPFSKEQLQGWRGVLPMDLPLTYVPPGASQAQQGQQQADVRAEPVPGRMELAKVLGDGQLLARWREDNPAKADHPNSAPTAAAYEEELGVGGGASAYAAAALAGLPANDDAVQVARLAAHSGRSIQELLSFNYGSGGIGDYTTTALHSKGRGRIQAAGAQGEGLYDEMSSWVDASTVEQQLAKAAERRKKGLSGKELQALKARKLEMKKKKTMEWLTR